MEFLTADNVQHLATGGQTSNGYDVINGREPICWLSSSSSSSADDDYSSDPSNTALQEHLPIYMMRECYPGVMMQVAQTERNDDGDEISTAYGSQDTLLVKVNYTFTIKFRVQQSGLTYTDAGANEENTITRLIPQPEKIRGRLILCSLSQVSFCTPFVDSHDGTDVLLDDFGFFDTEGEDEDKRSGYIASPFLRESLDPELLVDGDGEKDYAQLQFAEIDFSVNVPVAGAYAIIGELPKLNF